MEESLNKEMMSFEIAYYGLTLKFELFSIEYIWDKLKIFEQKYFISSIERLQLPEKKPFSSFKEIYTDANGKEKYHFFAYIKFFEFKEQLYGLVGGKTNYPSPDISFDYMDDKKPNQIDKRIARTFLKDKNYRWSREIIIVNHKPFLDEREMDKRQAIFLERFLQRQFNLFDS